MNDKKIEFPGAKPPELAEDQKSLGESLAMATGIDLSSREKLNKINLATKKAEAAILGPS